MAIKVIKQWKDFSMFPYYQLTTDSSSSLYHQRSISISLRFVRASSNQISGRVNSYWCPKSNALLTFLDPKAAFFKVSIIYLEYFFHFCQQKILKLVFEVSWNVLSMCSGKIIYHLLICIQWGRNRGGSEDWSSPKFWDFYRKQ